MMRLISTTFPSVKLRDCNLKTPELKKSKISRTQVSISSSSSQSQEYSKVPNTKSWCVYLILSTTEPIKTYVGITTDFTRRLKQHNGEIRGGAKASSAGRPWLCACIISGFNCLSQASSFESKWKIFSRKLPRRKKNEEMNQRDALLQHRKRALDKVEESLDCSHLQTDWKILVRFHKRFIGELNNPTLSETGSSVFKKQYTGDDELDDLDMSINSFISAPGTTSSSEWMPKGFGRRKTVRYQLLREIWNEDGLNLATSPFV